MCLKKCDANHKWFSTRIMKAGTKDDLERLIRTFVDWNEIDTSSIDDMSWLFTIPTKPHTVKVWGTRQ